MDTERGANWPCIMDMENFYVFRFNRQMRYFEVKPISMKGMVLEPTYPGHQGGLLLDQVLLHCTSEDDFFDTIMRCVSPVGLQGVSAGFDPENGYRAKRRFFAALRQKMKESGISLCQNISLSSTNCHYTIGNVIAAFNLKTVALLSLPAYSVLDFNGRLIPIAPDDSRHKDVTCPMHDFRACGEDVTCFDDYFRTFLQGALARNNSDMFLTLYGLAYAIEVFVSQMNWEGFDRFEDFIAYEPLSRTLNSLVRMGALHSPFDKRPTWEYSPTGADNAEQVAPDLAGTMTMVTALKPIAMLAPYENPFNVTQIFYGLIEHFSASKSYFGIDWNTHLTFPGDYQPFESPENDSGPSLKWEVFKRRFDGAAGVQARVPGTEEYAEFCPGMEGAPLLTYSVPGENGGFRMARVIAWNVPVTTLESGNAQIEVRGLKQLCEGLDPDVVTALESDVIESWNGLRVANINDLEEFFKDRPVALAQLAERSGVRLGISQSQCIPNLEPRCYRGEITGFGCTAPNGINDIYYLFDKFMLPTMRCISANGLISDECYVWDMPEQKLAGDGDQLHRAMGLRQLCEKNCPGLIDELVPHVFTFFGIAVIPQRDTAEPYTNATGEKLRKKSNFHIWKPKSHRADDLSRRK